MTPTPVVLGLTLCDYVLVEEKTKKVSLIGTFTGMAVSGFPSAAQPFSIFAALTEGIGSGTIELVITRLDTGEEVYSYHSPLHFPNKLTEVSWHLRLREYSFPAAGVYQFTLLVDGEWVAQRRLRVYQREDTP